MLVVVAVIVVSALVPAFLGLRMAQTAVGLSTSDVTARLNDGKRPIPPADLASVPQGGGWKVLATTPPEGGFADFDPVASLPWAMAIGRAWASDAVLTRIDVGRVSATGVVDLGGEAGSGYRFASPGRHERWINETDAGGKSLTATGLMLEIKGTQVRALPHEERTVASVPAPESLPLAEILERARGGRGFEDKPVLRGLPDPPAARRLGVVLPRGLGQHGLPAGPRPRRPRLPVSLTLKDRTRSEALQCRPGTPNFQPPTPKYAAAAYDSDELGLSELGVGRWQLALRALR